MSEMKIVIAGPTKSGKTSLFNLLAQKKEAPKQTIGPVFYAREIKYGSKMKKLKIIDTSGNPKFRNITRSFLKGINGCLLVFDLTDKDSFEKINDWFYELKRSQIVQIVLIGNKKDQQRQISEKTVKLFASIEGIQYFETDFKDKEQIEKILECLIQNIYAFEIQQLKKDLRKI
jgi:small GTP-binding protein